ncbi:MAG: DegT/DnrJ/EryC1/StrS aminotransferase family protein [Candidatus Altiarchaeota archaeon]
MKIPAAKIYFPEEDKKDILEKINGILGTGWLTLGKYGKEFEEKFAVYVGTKFATAVNSGTSSIEIPLRIFDVKDKEVLVPTNTFVATPAAVLHAGGKVKFLDMDPETFSIDPDELNEKITKKTGGVIIVHIGGLVTPKIGEIKKICEDNDVFLFEDAAHAHGSTLDGKMAGTFGQAASFSFYPTKVMTSGEGGMIVTDDEEMDKRARVFRDQGKAGFLGNIHTELGYNWRMSEIHAVIGLSQFSRLEGFLKDRRNAAKVYDKRLNEVDKINVLKIPENSKSNYYKYIAVLDDGVDRAELKKKLKEKYDVSLSGEVYELPCHLQPIFKDAHGYKEGDFPIAEDLCKRHICLPVYATMTKDDANYVVDSLKEVL